MFSMRHTTIFWLVPTLALAGQSHTREVRDVSVSVLRRLSTAGEAVFDVEEGAGRANAVAVGTFEDKLHSHGWGKLNIETNSDFPDVHQAFAAGFAEGYMTARDIYEAQQNLYPIVFGKNVSGVHEVNAKVIEFMDRQEAWSRAMVAKLGDGDHFWAQVGNVIAQFDGLIEGYGEAAKRGHAPHVDRFAFTLLNGVGDFFDIVPAVQKESRIDWLILEPDDAELKHTWNGHCSGLIKVSGDFSDLYMAHSSWFTYSNTNRIFKHYFLNYNNPSTAARRISMSSYPGYLESLDDFYMLDSGLGWIQTTNSVLDHSTYDSVTPESLLAWQRVRVASAMAHSGREWYEVLRQHFSGTYANQYMVVDFKKFEPNKPIKPDLLWVIEEMPGTVVGGDVSETLARGYWPSYNIPYWPEIYEKSGYPKLAEKHGNYFTYEMNPRAKIFRRDQGKVTDLTSLKSLMRSNDYLHDPYSLSRNGEPNPTYAICSRGDLHKTNASANGCYDTKVTSYNFGFLEGHAEAINGMARHTTAEGDLPPFTWNDARFKSQKHVGLPEIYLFDFIDIKPAKPWGFPPAPAAQGSDEVLI